MAPVRRILGVIVIVIGIVIVGLGFTNLSSQSVTAYPLSSAQVQTITPTVIGGGTLMVSWNGAGSGTVVTLYNCGSTCPQPGYAAYAALSKAGSGTGGSGSFSASVTGGTTYALVENGTASSVVTTTQQSGLTGIGIIGIIVAIIGVILVAIPMRRKAPAGEAEAEPAAEENFGASMPEAEPEAAAPLPEAAAPVAPVPAPAPARPSPAPSSSGGPTPAVSYDVSAAQANARGRPNLTCAHCGALNEPWITNCRRCKRPLSKTG